MNVLRFTGKDNRSALQQVRQQLGSEALILSTKRTAAGIEICAAASLPDFSDARPASEAGNSTVTNPNEFQMAALKRELASLRETLQSALGERKWQDSAGKRPVSAAVAQRLHKLGVGRVLAGEIADSVPATASLDEAWQAALNTLDKRIHSLSEAELAGYRIKIVVGASGCGKTRTAIALLADALQRHGPEHVAVIHCGDPRERTALTHSATAVNLPVYSAPDHAALQQALSQCRWAREVIIDTPALTPAQGIHDPVIALLSKLRGGAAAFLVLPASAQPDHLRELAEHALALPLAGAVITKSDEAISLGGVIDVAVSADLPIAGRMRTETQVLVSVSGTELINNAKRLAKRTMKRRAAQLKVAV